MKMPARKNIPKKGKLSPAMASRIRAKANRVLVGAGVKPDKDSAAGAAT